MRAVSMMSLFLASCGLSQHGIEIDDSNEFDGPSSLEGLETSSDSIDFGYVEPGTTEFQDLVLTNTSQNALEITEAWITGDGVFDIDTITSLPSILEPGFSEIVTLTFSPIDELDYSGDFALSLSTYDDDLFMPLSGSGNRADDSSGTEGGISIDTTSIDFGEVETGTETLEMVTITNEMTEDVLVRNLTFSDANYRYTGDLVPPTVMSAGSSKSFYVVFSPDAEGSYPATMTIETDIDGGSNYDVPLDGSAVEPDCEICTPSIRVTTNSDDEHVMNFLSVYNFPDEQIVSIQNMSDVELTISDAYLSNDGQGGEFRLSFSPTTLGPWETSSGVITYTCPELCFDYPNPVSDTNILHIVSDDPSEPDYQVQLWTGL